MGPDSAVIEVQYFISSQTLYEAYVCLSAHGALGIHRLLLTPKRTLPVLLPSEINSNVHFAQQNVKHTH